MVSLVFVFSILYTFVSMVWFILANEFGTKNKMPKCLKAVASCVKRILYWIFDEKPFWKRKINQINAKTEIIEVIVISQKDQELNNQNGKLKDEAKPIEVPIKSTCFNCGFCEMCQKDKEKEKKKKNDKESSESNVSALNYLVCFIMASTMVTCNLIIWLIIKYPPKGYTTVYN